MVLSDPKKTEKAKRKWHRFYSLDFWYFSKK